MSNDNKTAPIIDQTHAQPDQQVDTNRMDENKPEQDPPSFVPELHRTFYNGNNEYLWSLITSPAKEKEIKNVLIDLVQRNEFYHPQHLTTHAAVTFLSPFLTEMVNKFISESAEPAAMKELISSFKADMVNHQNDHHFVPVDIESLFPVLFDVFIARQLQSHFDTGLHAIGTYGK